MKQLQSQDDITQRPSGTDKLTLDELNRWTYTKFLEGRILQGDYDSLGVAD